jgi:hypothetical protein
MSAIDIIQLVEALQLDSQEKVMGSNQVAILAQHEAFKKFYDAFNDPKVSNSDRALLAQSVKDFMFGEPSEVAVLHLQSCLDKLPIRFTTMEPPSLAGALAASFARVWRFAGLDLPNAKFTLATDLTYRPHASVQEWEEDQYLVLMGRYLLADLLQFAKMLAAVIADIWQDTDTTPWEHEDFPEQLLNGLENRSIDGSLATYCVVLRKVNVIDLDSCTRSTILQLVLGLSFMLGRLIF